MPLVDSLMPSPQQWLILGGMAAALAAAWVLARRRRPVDGSPAQYRREIDGAVQQGQTVNRDLRELIAELEQLASRINGQLDAKAAELQKVLDDADRRITAFRTLIEEVHRLSEQSAKAEDKMGSHGSLSAGGREESPGSGRNRQAGPQSEVRVAGGEQEHTGEDSRVGGCVPDVHRDQRTSGSHTQPEAAPPPPTEPDPPAPTVAVSDRRLPVYALADEGLTPLQIAQRLGQPIGEIELILNLRESAGRRG